MLMVRNLTRTVERMQVSAVALSGAVMAGKRSPPPPMISGFGRAHFRARHAHTVDQELDVLVVGAGYHVSQLVEEFGTKQLTIFLKVMLVFHLITVRFNLLKIPRSKGTMVLRPTCLELTVLYLPPRLPFLYRSSGA